MRNKTKILIKTTLLIMAIALGSVSPFGVGNAAVKASILAKRCNSTNSTNSAKGYCYGYVAAFLDSYMLTVAVHRIKPQHKLFCLPASGITLKKAVEVVVEFFKNNPEKLSRPARALLLKAYMQKYQCHSKQRSISKNLEGDTKFDERFKD